MSSNAPIRAAAGEIARQFSRFTDMALTNPVIVTKNGRERNVILSIDEYHRLIQRDRAVYKAEDTPAVFMSEIDKLIESLPEA